jgi:hypothetical protein
LSGHHPRHDAKLIADRSDVCRATYDRPVLPQLKNKVARKCLIRTHQLKDTNFTNASLVPQRETLSVRPRLLDPMRNEGRPDRKKWRQPFEFGSARPSEHRNRSWLCTNVVSCPGDRIDMAPRVIQVRANLYAISLNFRKTLLVVCELRKVFTQNCHSLPGRSGR